MMKFFIKISLTWMILAAVTYIPGKVLGENNLSSTTPDEAGTDTTDRALTDDLYSLLYHSVFIDTSKRQNLERRDFFIGEEYFMPYRGSRISSIRLLSVPTFGGSVYDTTLTPTSNIALFANNAHIRTRASIISNNLMFAPNDTVAPFLLSDNERIIRNLPFIRDARIYVKPLTIDSAEVALTVVTQDIFPIGIGGSANNINSFNLDIYDRNLFGMGWELNNGLRFRSGQSPELGYDGRFYINNIQGSFISSTLNYTNVQERETFLISFDKAFLTPQTKYAGGLAYNHTTFYNNLIDSTREKFYRLNRTDLWFGRGFQIGGTESRRNVTFALRFNTDNYNHRPDIKPDSNFVYHNQELVLASMFYSKIYYTTSNLIRSFGRTEDIPLGYRFDFTVGYSNGEFENRQYGSIGMTGGMLLDHLGYLSGLVQFGAYYDGYRLENGVLNASLYYFTQLIPLDEFRFRQFVYADYTIGFNRIDETLIEMKDNSGIRWLASETFKGQQRFSLKFESVVFSPWNLLGFRFALAGFLDTGFIGSNYKVPDIKNMYSSVGFTLRLRNINLVINTFEIGFAFYPRTPEGVSPFSWHFSTSEPRAFTNLEGKKPTVLIFR